MSFVPRGLPPDQQALYDAYVVATGRPLYLSTPRRFMLRQLAERGVTGADVAAVLGMIKTKIARGDGGFNEASLDFRNCMEPDAMEDRVWRVREARRRRKNAQAKPLVARTDTLPDGSKLSRLDVALPRDPAAKSLKEMVAEAMGRES